MLGLAPSNALWTTELFFKGSKIYMKDLKRVRAQIAALKALKNIKHYTFGSETFCLVIFGLLTFRRRTTSYLTIY